jgi:hypothetical protein
MSKKKGTANPVVRVKPSLGKPRSTSAERVATTTSTVAAMKASPDWPAATDVQTSVAKWSTAASDIAANAAVVAQLKDQLAVAVAKQVTLNHTWSVCTSQVLTSVDAFCANAPARIQGFGLVAVTNTVHGLLGAPSNIATSSGPLAGEVRCTWDRGLADHGFVVQHATDTGNPATISPSIPCTKVKFTLAPSAASPSGSVVHFRVAAIDPHATAGQSPWSAWVSGTVL